MCFAPTTINPYNNSVKEKYLSEGKQTKITTTIKEISSSIEGDNFEFVIKLLRWINEKIKNSLPEGIEKNDIFRKRTADQIITDKYASGCTDFALTFIALARSKGIPTKYVECISRDYFDDKNLRRVRGHVFAECYLKGSWYRVNPMTGTVFFAAKYPKRYVVYAEGLDSWDLGIYDMPTMREKFGTFTEKFNSEQKGD